MSKTLSTVTKNIRRAPYQALAAVMILTITFLAASIFTLTSLGSRQILNYFETRPQVTAFFSDTATDQDITNLKAELEKLPIVSATKFVSKEEALSIYRQQNKDDPLLLEMVTAEILPASLEVSGISIDSLPAIAAIMTGKPAVEDVVYQKDVIESLKSWTTALRISGLALVGFLVITSTLIIVVIIGMKMALKRREIEILHLLGASPSYIKKPFIVEGACYGITGAILAWGITYVGLLYLTPFLVSFLGNIPVLPVPFSLMFSLLGVSLVAGLIIGSLGSLIGVSRFLKVSK